MQSAGAASSGTGLRIDDDAAPEEWQAAEAAERLVEGTYAGVRPSASEPALRRQTPDDEPKKTLEPLLPIPGFDKFDIKPYVPLPGGSAPTPYDPPSKVPDILGGGPSMGDLNAGWHTLFDKNAIQLGANAGKMPSCSALETGDSTRENRRYHSFGQYEQDRRIWHGPMSKDPWPQLSEAEYKSFIDACPKGEQPLLKLDFPVEKPSLQDAPQRTLPTGEAYA